MPILKLHDQYLVWSSGLDAPVTYGLTRKQLERYIKAEYGQRGLLDLPRRIARADALGTSDMTAHTLEETIACNTLGPGGRAATPEEIYCWYCVERTGTPHREP